MPKSPKSLRGRFLIARPGLTDPHFAQSIVFLAEHNEEGALGFILNRPLRATLADCAVEIDILPSFDRIPMLHGGPVGGKRIAVVVFTLTPKQRRLRALYGLSARHLDAWLDRPDTWVRGFLGCAGWDAGQLEREIREDSWLVLPADPAALHPRLASGLWPFLISGDNRWRALIDYLPEETDRN